MSAMQETPAGLVPDTNFTVEEAARFVNTPAPLPTHVLGQLGKDCSRVCRIRGQQWTIRPTPTKPWPSERAYPAEVIREVFSLHPETRDFLPK